MLSGSGVFACDYMQVDYRLVILDTGCVCGFVKDAGNVT